MKKLYLIDIDIFKNQINFLIKPFLKYKKNQNNFLIKPLKKKK